MTVGYTLGPNEGEHLVLRGGSIFIKADPSRGSDGITMVTQQVLAGVGIPIHRHLFMDETLYVLEGSRNAHSRRCSPSHRKGWSNLYSKENLAWL